MLSPDIHDTRILPVILAGGNGERLRPISTPAHTKPFLPMEDGKSLLTHAALRIRDQKLFQPPLIIGRARDRFALLNHLREAEISPAAILLEAAPKNTAPAIALAVQWAMDRGLAGSMLAILPADHRLGPDMLWQQTIRMAAMASRLQQKLALLAIPAHQHDARFGYILLGEAPGEGPARPVTRFVEKPEPEDVQALIRQGAWWNMGQFIAPVGLLAAAFTRHAPGISDAARQLLANAEQEWEYTILPPFPKTVISTPFDRAIVEKTPAIAVPFAGQWEDLGTLPSWKAMTGLDADYYATLPPRTDRPWGYFELLEESKNRVRKQLVIYPGCRLSRQRHQHRSEHWLVTHGIAHVEKDDTTLRLTPGKSVQIPAGCWHRLSNHHPSILIIEEIQDGRPMESDIERDGDDYGRI
jgi:mannose-1-phosphate guanylyltransferase/mannose-6-phosphate isomerase-like protein (cupin superfamily)